MYYVCYHIKRTKIGVVTTQETMRNHNTGILQKIYVYIQICIYTQCNMCCAYALYDVV